MRAFVLRLVLFLALAGAGIAWVLQWHVTDPVGYHSATVQKHTWLRENRGKSRLILVGGSGLVFGLNSGMLAEAFPGFVPVNMGLQVDLGLDFKLNEIAGELRPGDCVVVCVEYPHFGSARSSRGLAAVSVARPQNLAALRFREWKALADDFFPIAGHYVQEAAGRMRSAWSGAVSDGRVSPRDMPGYRHPDFNQWGDAASFPPKPVPALTDGLMPPGLYTVKAIDRFIERLNAFGAFCSERNVQVFYSHPAMPLSCREPNGPMLEVIERRFAARLRIPRLDAADDMVFPDAVFYDCAMHLNEAGSRMRTEVLIAGLERKLAAIRGAGP